MNFRRMRWLLPSLGLLVIGCLAPVQEKVDRKVCELAAKPRDLAPDSYEKPPPRPEAKVKQAIYRPTDVETSQAIERAAFEEQAKPDDSKLAGRFKIPDGIPGSQVPDITLPKLGENDKERAAIISKLYPPLPSLGPDPKPAPGPEGKPLTLADLQRLALANSPLIRQATANVEAARGAAIQAGAYPNPNFAYESDDVGTNGSAGYQGFFFEQLIKTANKLGLARASAAMDLANAELALRRAETDLTYQVRGGYFAVLVARENITVSGALAKLTSDVYDVQVNFARQGPSASYEPAQLRVQAVQARASIVQARNRYTSAWKQLAATLGLPGMPPTELAGRIDIPIPRYDHEKVLTRALDHHTDILTARNSVMKNQFNLKLAQVTPIPDVTFHWLLQKDNTAPPNIINSSVQIIVPLPVWDRNQGGIIQAQGNLVSASEQEHVVRDQLTQTLATAFENYEDNRVVLEWYRDQILPDQVRAYRGVYVRYATTAGGPPIGNPPAFGDVVTAQQTLATTLQTYITTLGALWQSVVDVANVMQTDDLFQLNGEPQPTLSVCKLPDLSDLPAVSALPCQHPCSPLTDPRLRGGVGDWPPAVPEKGEGPSLMPAMPPMPEEKKEK